MNAVFSLFRQTTMAPQVPMRAFSMFMQRPATAVPLSLDKFECKKNKTTKQAEKKRRKRKTGADISIRNK